MELKFSSIDEVKEFMKQLKGTRGGRTGDGEEGAATGSAGGQAPAPLTPPAGGPGFPGAGGAATVTLGPAPGQAGGFPGAAGPAPEALALVTRINTRIDGAIAGGQPADQVLAWFRGQCGPEAANYTMDQIKAVALPKAAMPTLENIAKLMNA